MSALLCFASTFVAVFALGLQSLNVNGRHYWAAAGTSLAIGASSIALYKFMPTAGWISLETLGYLAGGVIGITSSMWFHRSVKQWWANRQVGRGGYHVSRCHVCGRADLIACSRTDCPFHQADVH